jgi:predicted ATPase
MIENMSVKNFKSLKDLSLKLAPLNLFAGLNGMGKSSMIQPLLLIKQSDSIGSTGQLKLKGWLVDLGKGRDLLYQFAEEETIDLKFELSGKSKLEWSFAYKPDWENLQSENKNNVDIVLGMLKGFQYISANRIGPQSMHEVSQGMVENKILGVRGEFAVHYLQSVGNRFKVDIERRHSNVKEPTLASQVNGWLGEISPGIKVIVSEVPGVDKMLLNYDFGLGIGRTSSFRPGNVGFGISYALSVIISLLTAEKDNIIIIENPEAHIHPRGQAELGKLMALTASCGAQLFIETHSDHIINGIRVAVKEKLIHENSVNLTWFSKTTRDHEQFSNVSQIQIDKNGELSEYPKDFLDEWNNQLLKLV